MPHPDPIAKALVEAVLELNSRRLWLEVEPDSPFLVHLPDAEHAFVVVVTGHIGEEYGLFILRGPQAFADIRRVIEGGGGPDVMDPADVLNVSVDPLGAIPPEHRGPLEAARFQGRRERLAPHLVVKPPHRLGRSPGKAEQRTMLLLIRAVLAAHDAGELPGNPFDERRQRILELRAEGTWRSVTVSARFVAWPTGTSPTREEKMVSLPPDLAELPRLDETWLADFPLLPGAPDGGDQTGRCLIILIDGTHELLALELMASNDPGPAGALLVRLLRGEGPRKQPGLPRSIRFASHTLHWALAPALAALGVRAELTDDTAPFEDLVDRLAEIAEVVNPDLVLSPHAPQTLEEWKAADLALTRRLAADIRDGELDTSRALARYFGSEEDAEEVMDQLDELRPRMTFCAWLLSDFRPTRRSIPHLEKLLRGRRLSATERRLIEARVAGHVSIFRIDATEPGLSLEVEDVLTGRRYTVHDRALSGCDVVGCFLPLRLVHVADWIFLDIFGPPLSQFTIDEALGYIESQGTELTPEGLRRNSYVLGHLWQLLLEDRQTRPTLQNTDGDPLVLQTATFRVRDPEALRRSLAARDDVTMDESDGSWVWSRSGGPAPGIGESTTLAHLEMLDDRLVVTVNSERRLERIRDWLEEIGGVAFERATSSEPFSADQPLDDRLPHRRAEPVPEEVVEQITAMFHAQCLRWLDLPIPALRGQTPRAACKTPSGRAEVALMIRTTPAMTYPGGTVPVPRTKLFHALGIEATA